MLVLKIGYLQVLRIFRFPQLYGWGFSSGTRSCVSGLSVSCVSRQASDLIFKVEMSKWLCSFRPSTSYNKKGTSSFNVATTTANIIITRSRDSHCLLTADEGDCDCLAVKSELIETFAVLNNVSNSYNSSSNRKDRTAPGIFYATQLVRGLVYDS